MDDDLIESRVLTPEEGGGFLAWASEFPGCMSDGESPEEAESHCREAIVEWLDQARHEGIAIPQADRSRVVAR